MVTHRDILRLEFFLSDINLFEIIGFFQLKDSDSSLEKRLMSPKIITHRGETFLGLQKTNDNCIFFEENTCQIYECRPQICRCFPFTFQIREGQIFWGYTAKSKEYCPAIEKESKQDTEYLAHLASEILEESNEFEQLIQIWNHLARNNLIKPTPELLLQFITGKIKLSIENLERLNK